MAWKILRIGLEFTKSENAQITKIPPLMSNLSLESVEDMGSIISFRSCFLRSRVNINGSACIACKINCFVWGILTLSWCARVATKTCSAPWNCAFLLKKKDPSRVFCLSRSSARCCATDIWPSGTSTYRTLDLRSPAGCFAHAIAFWTTDSSPEVRFLLEQWVYLYESWNAPWKTSLLRWKSSSTSEWVGRLCAVFDKWDATLTVEPVTGTWTAKVNVVLMHMADTLGHCSPSYDDPVGLQYARIVVLWVFFHLFHL